MGHPTGVNRSSSKKHSVRHPPRKEARTVVPSGLGNAWGGSLLASVRSLLGQKLCEQFAGVGQLPRVGLVTNFEHGIG